MLLKFQKKKQLSVSYFGVLPVGLGNCWICHKSEPLICPECACHNMIKAPPPLEAAFSAHDSAL
jgi:hypothetical protein